MSRRLDQSTMNLDNRGMEDYIRDYAMTAALLGTFAFAWFGWAQQDPPKAKKWPILLGIGSGISFLIATAGAILAWRNWGGPSVLAGDAFAGYMWIFVIEFIAIALAVVALLIARRARYLPTVVAFIVGVHFYPLAPVFQDAWLYVLATIVTIASLYPLFFAKKLGISLVTLTCVSVAIPLFIFAVRGLLMAVF